MTHYRTMTTTNDTDVTDRLWQKTSAGGVRKALTAVLVAVYLEAFLWTTTRVFFLNFTTAGPNATAVLFLLLVTGWSLAVAALVGSDARRVYAGACALLVVGFVVSVVGSPAVAGLGSVAMVTSVTPMIVGLLDDLHGGIVGGVAGGVLLSAGVRAFLLTASPYATPTGLALLSCLVVLAVLLTFVLAAREELPTPDWRSVGASPAPLGVLLVASAGFFAYPQVVARWGLRSYAASVVALAAGVVAGLVFLHLRDTVSAMELAASGAVFLLGVGAFLYVPHPATTAAYGAAWAAAVVLLAAGSRRVEGGVGTGTVSLFGFQLLAVLLLFGYVSAINWAFMPPPLSSLRGLTTEFAFAVHAAFPLSVAFAVARGSSASSPDSQDASPVSRRSVLAGFGSSLLPLGGLLSARVTGERVVGASPSSDDETVRVMAYNLHLYLEEESPGGFSLTEIHDVIDEDGADVIGICESDGCRLISGNVDGVEWLGEKLGYHTEFGAPTRLGSPGVGILSKWPIDEVEYVELPISESPTRIATLATVRAPDGPLRVVATHFMTEKPGDVRDEEAERLVELLNDEDSAVVLGDFNVEPDRDNRAYRVLDDAFTDAWKAAEETVGGPNTWSSADPVKRIDYVFLKGGWRVHETEVSGNPRASDHLAVSAEIEPSDEAKASTDGGE